MPSFCVQTNARCEMLDITPRVAALVPPSLSSGLCHAFCPHTTAALTVNENADPDVRSDILAALERLVPRSGAFAHAEGNGDAHVKASLMGHSAVLPVASGRLSLGPWQGLFLCEFDGPRRRTVEIRFSPASF